MLCSVSRPDCVRAFHWKVIFFLFLSLAIPLFGLLSHVSSLRLSSGHSRLVLTLSTDYTVHSSLSSPRSLVVDASVQATSLLAVVVRRIFCGILFFFLPVMLPSEIPKLPTDPPVRGFPIVWKFLLLHDSLFRMGLHPELFCLIFLSFIFCPTSFQREWAAFLSAWYPPVFRSCFVEVAQHSNDLLMHLWGRK